MGKLTYGGLPASVISERSLIDDLIGQLPEEAIAAVLAQYAPALSIDRAHDAPALAELDRLAPDAIRRRFSKREAGAFLVGRKVYYLMKTGRLIPDGFDEAGRPYFYYATLWDCSAALGVERPRRGHRLS